MVIKPDDKFGLIKNSTEYAEYALSNFSGVRFLMHSDIVSSAPKQPANLPIAFADLTGSVSMAQEAKGDPLLQIIPWMSPEIILFFKPLL
jgi:hypothetical protein